MFRPAHVTDRRVQVVTCSGGYGDGSLRIVRNGIGMSEVSDARLIGNTFSEMGSDGIDIALSRRIFVDGTRCHDFKPTPGAHADCIQLWSRPNAPPTADITIINTVAAGDMQGVTAFNHVRNGVDDGGFDRITFANNDIRITYAQAVSLYDCRDCIARDNFVDTWPQAHNRARVVVQGEVPSALNPPSGCRFHTRCPQAMARCRTDDPPLQDMGGGRAVACHLHQVTVSTQLATDAAWTPP